MEHTSHSSRCLGGCRRRQGCQQSHRCRDRRRQNPRASAAAAAVAAAAREWLVGAAPVAAVGALGRSSSATRRAVVHPKPTFGRGHSRTTRNLTNAVFSRRRTVPLLAPSASPRDRSNEARRARVAAVRRGRRRLGGWWLPSCAAAFRVEKRFRVPPASVQRGGGAASSPLWHPERPEGATTEER